MDTNKSIAHFTEQIKTWIDAGQDNEAIHLNLKKMDLDEAQLIETLVLLKKIRSKKRTQSGSMLVLIGIVILGLGFISCIVLHYLGSDINFSLFGLTGIGAMTLIVGLILIFN